MKAESLYLGSSNKSYASAEEAYIHRLKKHSTHLVGASCCCLQSHVSIDIAELSSPCASLGLAVVIHNMQHMRLLETWTTTLLITEKPLAKQHPQRILVVCGRMVRGVI